MQNRKEDFTISREFDGLNIRAVNILVKANILKVDDLVTKKEDDLLKLPNMGPYTVNLIRKWLNDKGLDLKPDFSSLSINLCECKDLYWPTVRTLQYNDVFTLEDLLSKTEDDICDFTGIYPHNYSIIKTWLKKHHLHLASSSN